MFRLVGLVTLTVALCFAQGERGTLNGTVTDATGSVVPGAMVTAKETTTNVETKATTTAAGVYRIPYLPPGVYTVTVTATGFRTATAERVELRVAQTLTLDFKLEVGQITEQVTVTSQSPQLETGTAEIGRYVSKREFDTWPIQVDDGQRQIQTFIFSSLPGTNGNTFQGSINGGQNYSHEILIEGMPLGRFDLQGGSNNEFSPSADAVSEFKMQTGTIGAQYGGGLTAVANFAIKSGTNDLHGSAFTYVQNDVLRANSFDNNALGLQKPPYKLTNWGYSIGGPVYIPKVYDGRNKTFFFTNLENTRVRDFSSASRTTLPIPAFKRGDFSQLLNPAFTGDPQSGSVIGTDALGRPVVYGQIYDPLTTRSVNGATVRDPFPGNIIPTSRFNPVSAKILELAPITDPISTTLLNNMPSLSSCCPVFDQRTIGVKIDHIFNEKHRLAGYFNYERRERNNSPNRRWGAPPGSPTDVYQLQNTPGRLARLAEDWTITPTWLNHFAIGYNRFGNLNYSVFINDDWPSKIGLLNVPQTHFPVLYFVGAPVFGGGIGAQSSSGGQLGSNSRSGSFNGSTVVQDDMTIIHGKHSFKAGFEARFYYYNNRVFSGSGNFTFSPQQTDLPGFDNMTGQAFASFLLGAVQNTNREIVATNPGYRTRMPAFYFSDDWKVTPKLTLSLGVRWEIVGGIYEVASRMTNLDPNAPNPEAGGRPGALVFAVDKDKNTFQDTSWKQISPRVGFAYAFTPGFVMRGGYGINTMAPVTNFNQPSLFGYNATVSLTAANTSRQFAQDPVMYLNQPYPSLSGSLPDKNPSLANGNDVSYMAPNSSRLGYVQNWNFGLGIQLPASFVLDVSYIANKGTRLISYGLDALNQLPVSALRYGDALLDPLASHPELGIPLPYPGFDSTVAQALRPFPQYGNISQYQPNFGMSTFNSVQITATRHFTNGLAVLAAYTWSKALTDSDSPLDTVASQDVYNRRLEKSVASFNVPQYFKLTWIYELPFGPNKRFAFGGVPGAIFGGWTVSAIQNYRSGNALALTSSNVSADPLFNGGHYRPNALPNVPQVVYNGEGLDYANGTPYLNPAAFQALPTSAAGVPLQLGTVSRYLPNVRGPAQYTENLSLSKRFPFGEQRFVEFRGDFINVFNRHGLGDPVTDVADPNFGRVLSFMQGPRSIQLGLRVTF